MRYPDFEKQFTLTADASNYAIGAVLPRNGHPGRYASRTLNNHEGITLRQKEFLVIMWSVNYICARKFKIFTDHQPIKDLHSKYRGKYMSPRHQRWLLKLGEYQFEMEYLKGRENKVPDFLSGIKNSADTIQRKRG